MNDQPSGQRLAELAARHAFWYIRNVKDGSSFCFDEDGQQFLATFESESDAQMFIDQYEIADAEPAFKPHASLS